MSWATRTQYKDHFRYRDIVFTGADEDYNDLSLSGIYRYDSSTSFVVKISTAAATDKFQVSLDGGSTFGSETSITGSAQSIGRGISITFDNTTGHTLNDQWAFSSDDIKADSEIDDALEWAEAELRHRTGKDYGVSETTRYFDADRDVEDNVLYLDRPCCSITTLTNGDGTTISSDDYVTVPVNSSTFYAIRLKSNAGVSFCHSTSPESAISVTGYFGQSSTPTVPAEAKDACIMLARWKVDQNSGVARVMKTKDGKRIEVEREWPSSVLTFIDTHQRITF